VRWVLQRSLEPTDLPLHAEEHTSIAGKVVTSDIETKGRTFMNDSEVIYCAYSYSEGRCVEAAHKIQRAMAQWHRRVMMLPQDDSLFLNMLSKADLAETWLVPEGALVVGVGVGGLVAAMVQETKRPDLDVVCVSSPTSHGVIKLERKMERRVALYSSEDPAIAGRVENWPNLAEAHDTPYLMHGAHLHPYILRKLILAHRGGRDLGAEMAHILGVS
jgi:hypothetical protein